MDIASYTIPKYIIQDARIPLLRSFAQMMNKSVAVFDFETTTLLANPGFGITEACLVIIPPHGEMVMYADLVNPEYPIDPKVVELNGITDEMVASQPTFAVWIPLFKQVARDCLMIGFNTTSFDVPTAEQQAKRYGGSIEFADSLDLRNRYIDLMRLSGCGRKGKLSEVLAVFGIVLEDGWHRAGFDGLATSKIAEAMLLHYGISGLLGRPLHALPTATENPNKVRQVLTNEHIHVLNGIRALGYDKMRMAQELDTSVNKISEIAWDLFYGGNVRIEEIAEPEVQTFIDEHIHACVEAAWVSEETNRRLKPVMLELCKIDGSPRIDYTQLKVGLTRCGLR